MWGVKSVILLRLLMVVVGIAVPLAVDAGVVVAKSTTLHTSAAGSEMLIDSPCHAATVMNAVLLIDLLNQNFKIHIFMHGISYHFKEMKGNFSNYSAFLRRRYRYNYMQYSLM